MSMSQVQLDNLKNERDYIKGGKGLESTIAALDWAINEIEQLRAHIAEIEAMPTGLSGETKRMYRYFHCLDVTDLDDRAEKLMRSHFDGVMVGPANRAGIKAELAKHFHDIRNEAARLRTALRQIEGGNFPGASTAALHGEFATALQEIARDALNN